jgi:hypothetical protein
VQMETNLQLNHRPWPKCNLLITPGSVGYGERLALYAHGRIPSGFVWDLDASHISGVSIRGNTCDGGS